MTLRCNNREFLFEEPWFARFIDLLQRWRAGFGIKLLSHCVMTNHVHVVFQIPQASTLSRSMHWLSTTFVRQFNRATGRRGHLWEGRFRSTIIEAPTYLLRCMAYVDLNPVRAGMVGEPGEYPWGSHRALQAEDATLLDINEEYLGLGPDAASRYRFYRELLAEEARRPAVSLARAYFAGSPRFVRRMERRFGLDAAGRAVRRVVLASGLVCAEPSHGRAPGSR